MIVGQDWENLGSSSVQQVVGGQDANKKAVHFAASNIANKDATLKETTGTKQNVDVLKGSVVQGGVSVQGSGDPFKFKAAAKDGSGDLLINGQKLLTVNANKDPSDITTFVIHEEGQYTLDFLQDDS